MRTAENAVRGDGASDIVLLEKGDDLLTDGLVGTDFSGWDGPFAEGRWLLLWLREDRDDKFGRLEICRTVGGDGGKRIFRLAWTH